MKITKMQHYISKVIVLICVLKFDKLTKFLYIALLQRGPVKFV